MTVKRVQMPNTHGGKPVSDRYACGYGHLHPSHSHAVKCLRRIGEKEQLRKDRDLALGFIVYLLIFGETQPR